jgi:hypothetical protein
VSFGIPVRNGLGVGLLASTSLSTRRGSSTPPGPTPALTLDFLTGTLDPRITFTRTTTGTYIGSDGLVKTAAIDEPRFEYDPTTLQPRGLLIEPSRTNLLLHSSDLTQAAWVPVGATIAMTATGPDGAANSATTVTATAGNATVLQAVIAVSAEYISSVYIKRRTGTGTIEITQNGGITWTAITVTAGWTRVATPAAILLNPTVGLRIVSSGDAVDVAFFQCETSGTTVVFTSVIPTGASQGTRTGDIALVTGTNFSSWYNATEGSMLAVFSRSTIFGVPFIYTVSNGTITQRWSAGFSASSISHRLDATTSQANINIAGYVANTISKSAFGVKLNSVQAAVNGVLGTEDTLANMPTVDRLNIGSSGTSAAQLTGHIRSLTYYPTRLTNAELQALTV